MHPLEESVKNNIREQGVCPETAAFVAGVSGGPDSLCMLRILREILPRPEEQLLAVHVNHGIRGEEALADQEATEQICRELGIPFRGVQADVPGLAAARGLTEEEAGRQARYMAFEEARASLQAPGPVYIAVAQTKDDLAETVLLRILRGTGPDGLAAISPLRADGVLRPLLGCTREQVEAYCADRKLSPRRDSTNRNTDYTRNRIRLELLPLLKEKFNPAAADSLCRLAEIAAEDRDYFRLQAESIPREEAPGECRFLRKDLAELHPAPAKRLILQTLQSLGLAQDVERVHLEQGLRLLREGKDRGIAQFPGGYYLELRREQAVFCSPKAEPPAGAPNFSVPFRAPDSFLFPSAGTLEVRLSADPPEPPFPGLCGRLSPRCLSQCEAPLQWRIRRPGDRVYPKGMAGSKKLQDFLVDRKIPREQRDRLPLLCSGNTVLWIPGVYTHRDWEGTEKDTSIIVLVFNPKIC